MERVDVFEKIWEHMGHTCVVTLNDILCFRCGYVLVDDDSPLFKRTYMSINPSDVCPHGGLTFSNMLELPGKSGWAFGFDCGHLGDIPDVQSAIDRYGDNERYHESWLLGGRIWFDDMTGNNHMWTLDDAVFETETMCEQIVRLESLGG